MKGNTLIDLSLDIVHSNDIYETFNLF